MPEDGVLREINFLEIGPQKTVWEVLGESASADILNGILVSLIAELKPETEFAEPLLFTQETHCTVRLAFSWKDLLSERLSDAMEELVRHRLDLPVASTRIASMNLRFGIQYDVSDLRIKEWGISVLDKVLTLEPLSGTPLSERLYSTSSPLDSDSHLRLVRDLETAIIAKQDRGATRRRAAAPSA